MILQKIQFPNPKICSRVRMYYSGQSFTPLMEEECCQFFIGGVLSTVSYFNSFSIGKWKKYTTLDNLYLRVSVKGEFSVHVRHAHKMNKEIKDIIVAEKTVKSEEKTDFIIPIPVDYNMGIYYFQLKALKDDCVFYGGAYETEVAEENLNDVKLAIGICTFRRESFVAKNMQLLNETILENPNSALYGKLEIFISDNAKTLDLGLATDKIHIFPNRNLGGAGGFTRSMIEIKKASAEKNFTHIMMMDDDISLNPDSLLRTFAMLRLLKAEHKEAFIGGHMLKIDAPYIQSEAADHWNIVAHHPVKYNYNLESMNFLLKNEIEDKINYFGWWYCCMPIDIVTDVNLPLPIFIKRDDIEYGLRNGKKFITLNGICVWHEPFEYKYATYLEYYYFRNMCIMNSRHRHSFDENRLIGELKKRVKNFIYTYRFKDAELSLLGVQHYLNGIDWFKKQDGEALNSALMQLGYQKEPMENLDYVFIHGNYEGVIGAQKLYKKQRIIRKLTLNGWLLPANKNALVSAYQPSPTRFYRVKNVVNYEEISNTAFVTSRSYRSLFYILKMYRQTVKLIKKNFKKVTLEFRDRYDELINIDFWNNYLFNPGEAPKLTSGLDKPRRPKNTPYQRKQVAIARVVRLLQILLFWLPVKKNRVMVSIYDRKGFSCNPKYIVKKLVEEYGKKLEIYWVTMHPSTCQEIEELGVKIIKTNSAEHVKKYLRTRFYITNDAFPAWAIHRPNQKWMNTWHAGMNYKHIGPAYFALASRLTMKLRKMYDRQANFHLSGSEFFTKDTAESYGYKVKNFVPTGLPRNDIFFEDQTEIIKKVREQYKIPEGKKLAIFAPTFRRGFNSDTYGMDFDTVKKALTERFGGEWEILFRNHTFVKGKQKYYGAVDVSAYHDMQELMCAADVLISDYSSCLYDFAITGKPVFVYAPDLDYYVNSDRSLAYPFEKWPYPSAITNDELLEKIVAFDEKDYKQKVEGHLRDTGCYDNGTASKQVADIVAKYCL